MSKKSPENWKNPKHTKIIAQISKIRFWKKTRTYVEKYTVGYLYTKFERFILIYESMIAKKWVWPTFGCKLGQSDPIMMKLKLDMSCHQLNVYTKFENDISKHVEKSPENSDGQTDGQTDEHFHGIKRPFFKRAYKNWHQRQARPEQQALFTVHQILHEYGK